MTAMTDIEFLSLKRKYFALYLYMLSICLMLVSIRPSRKNESVRSPVLQTPSYRAVTSINKEVQPEKLLQEGGPLPGPKTCLTLGNELSEETHVLTKQEILMGKGVQAESSRVREPRRTALPHGLQSRVLW